MRNRTGWGLQTLNRLFHYVTELEACQARVLVHMISDTSPPRNGNGKGLLAMTQRTTTACSQLKMEDTLIL